MSHYQNPFEPQTDQYLLWQMLVENDIEAFIHGDWDRVKDDFIQEGFTAIDAKGSDNPDKWRLSFKTLQEYRDVWLQQSREICSRVSRDNLRQALIKTTNMDNIEVDGSSALLHKKFNGAIHTDDGAIIPQVWQTIYQCVKINGQWKIGGFVGYLPYPMGTDK